MSLQWAECGGKIKYKKVKEGQKLYLFICSKQIRGSGSKVKLLDHMRNKAWEEPDLEENSSSSGWHQMWLQIIPFTNCKLYNQLQLYKAGDFEQHFFMEWAPE